MSQRTCTVEECDRPYWSTGYCAMHYQRWWKHGDPNVVAFSRGNTTTEAVA